MALMRVFICVRQLMLIGVPIISIGRALISDHNA